jgi:hypothetical protein
MEGNDPKPPNRQKLELPEQSKLGEIHSLKLISLEKTSQTLRNTYTNISTHCCSIDSKFLVTEEKRTKTKPKITAPPRSNLLDRLDKFLPALQQANAQLGSSDDAKLELNE